MKKLILENLFELSICTCLGLYAFYEGRGKWSNFWQTPHDQLNTVILILHAFLVMAFLVYSPWVILKNFRVLRTKKCKEQHEVLYEGLNVHHKLHALYNVFFLWRRALIALVLIFGGFWSFFQITCLVCMSFLNLCYQVTYKPFAENNTIEIVNELVIYCVGLLMSMLLDVAMPDHMANLMGWMIIVLATIDIGLNIAITAW